MWTSGEEKTTGGVSIRWVDTISRDLSWIHLDGCAWTDEHGEVSLISYAGQICEGYSKLILITQHPCG